MTKSEIFKTAHKIARLHAHLVGNYGIALSFALKAVYKAAKAGLSIVIKRSLRGSYFKAVDASLTGSARASAAINAESIQIF